MKNFKLLILLLISSLSQICAQNSFDTTAYFIKTLAAKYNNETPIKYSFQVKQLDSTGTEVLNATSGSMIKSKNLLQMTFDDYEIILHDSIMFYKVDSKKEIFLKKLTKVEFDSFNNYSIDKYIKAIKSQKIKIKQVETRGNETIYYMVFNNLSENLYIFKIDNTTGYISNIRIEYYDSNDRNILEERVMELSYYNYSMMDTKNYFPLNKYITHVNGKIQLKETYKSFNVKYL